jgi:hypothetical protein
VQFGEDAASPAAAMWETTPGCVPVKIGRRDTIRSSGMVALAALALVASRTQRMVEVISHKCPLPLRQVLDNTYISLPSSI